ncbi:MAG: hypothetical protein AAFQ16_06580 [Pseudomonadota bacterium]
MSEAVVAKILDDIASGEVVEGSNMYGGGFSGPGLRVQSSDLANSKYGVWVYFGDREVLELYYDENGIYAARHYGIRRRVPGGYRTEDFDRWLLFNLQRLERHWSRLGGGVTE